MLKICYMEKTIYIMYTYVTYDFKYIFTYISRYIYISVCIVRETLHTERDLP